MDTQPTSETAGLAVAPSRRAITPPSRVIFKRYGRDLTTDGGDRGRCYQGPHALAPRTILFFSMPRHDIIAGIKPTIPCENFNKNQSPRLAFYSRSLTSHVMWRTCQACPTVGDHTAHPCHELQPAGIGSCKHCCHLLNPQSCCHH